jgi:peptidoglycan/xylan/chitin deacetylase (PgdA/CDA1 family)
MSSLSDHGARKQFERLLGHAAAQGRRLDLWWRDDDAVTPSPALDRLLEIRRKHGMPLALAVIPAGATEALAQRLVGEPDVWVLQHGWRHAKHNRPGEKKAELGDQRPLAAILAELKSGREKLEWLFPRQFLPVLVPPWNRIGDAIRNARAQAGLPGLSGFGQENPAAPHQVNTHIDIFAWKPTRRPLSPGETYALLAREAERRLAGDGAPIGILTHHLVHEQASWELLAELLGLLAGHPAVRWPVLPKLFGMASG